MLRRFGINSAALWRSLDLRTAPERVIGSRPTYARPILVRYRLDTEHAYRTSRIAFSYRVQSQPAFPFSAAAADAPYYRRGRFRRPANGS